MKLRLADDLALPVEAVTQTILVVGKRGSGKSNTAARIVEQLHGARCPFVVLDPVDNWWGIKASRDGRGEGLKDVYVFGGSHADLPLEPGGGELMADVLCEHRTPMVLSVKHFTGGERSRFMTAFALRVLRKWSGGVLHVVLEEAHEFAPQSIPKGEQAEQMLGAFKRLWKLGRASGIGGTAVTQRPASLSKDITTQAEILIAHRTIGPQDVDAIKGWIRYHQESEETLGQLAGLGTGEAFVYSPEFPEGKAIGLRRVLFSLADTFDSRATPKPGERHVEPKALAPVDLDKLRSKMAATIERAKAEDPRELRRRISELERQKPAAPAPPKAPEPKRVEVNVLKEGHLKRLEAVSAALVKVSADISEALKRVSNGHRAPARLSVPRAFDEENRLFDAKKALERERAIKEGRAQRLGAAQRAMLTVLGQRIGKVTSRNQVGILSGYSTTSSHLDNTISSLRTQGFVQGGADSLVITDEGIGALGTWEELPRGTGLIEYWIRKTGKAPGAMLRALVDAYPATMTREEVALATGYSVESSHLDNSLSHLRTLELITGGRGELRASAELFE